MTKRLMLGYILKFFILNNIRFDVYMCILIARLKICKNALPAGTAPLPPAVMHHPAAPPITASITTAHWSIVDTRRCQSLVCPGMVATLTQC